MQGDGRLYIHAFSEVPDPTAAATDGLQPVPHARIDVVDEGIGIAPEHLERIFDPFFTTKAGSKGSGLGLAMVYGFVRQSGGTIRVRSDRPGGTCFTLLLPFASRAAPDPGRNGPDPIEGGAGEHILLVDDDPLVCRYATAILERLGYRVSAVHNGSEALATLRMTRAPEDAIRLLLADRVMPGMSGRELADHALALQPDLKLLFMSGYPEPPRGDSDAGSMLSKPFRSADLARAVRELLDRNAPS